MQCSHFMVMKKCVEVDSLVRDSWSGLCGSCWFVWFGWVVLSELNWVA